MDPVLSSTLDFDEYIKSNLKLSGQKFGATSTSRPDAKYDYGSRQDGEAKERPRSGSSTRVRSHENPRSSVGSSISSDYKPHSHNKDMSSDFFQLNISKFGQAKPVIAPPKSTYSRNSTSREETPPVSPTPPVVLQHSWKAHLNSSRPTTATQATDFSSSQSARVDRTANGTPYRGTRPASAIYDDDDLDEPSHTPVSKPRSQPPLPYRSPAPPLSPHRLSKSTTGWSLYSSNRNQEYASPITSPDRKPPIAKAAVDRADASQDTYPLSGKNKSDLSMDADFSEYKVRLVTLKRTFASWAVHARERAEQLAQQCRDVQENGVYWPKHSCFTWWKMLSQASMHVQTLRFRRGLRKWFAHYKRHRRGLTALRRAGNHHKYHLFIRFMNAMMKLGQRRRRRKRMRRLQAMSFDHWTSQLLKRVYNTWKQFINKTKADRLLDEEQSKRRDKIAQFMRRVQQPSPSNPSNNATTSTASGTRAEAKGVSSTRGHTGGAGRVMAEAKGSAHSTSSTNSAQSRLQPSSRESKQADRSSHSPAASTSALANTNIPAGVMNDECSDDECVEPFQRLSVQPSSYPSKITPTGPADAIKTTEEDYGEDAFESEDPPPPTYEQLMRQSLSSRSPSKPNSTGPSSHMSRASGGRDNQSTPPLPPSSSAAVAMSASARAESRTKMRSGLPHTTTHAGSTAGGVSGRVGVSGIPRSTSAPRGNRSVPANTANGIARTASLAVRTASDRAPEGTNTDESAPSMNVNEGLTGTFEERAAARRERTLLLRKQAEERIQEKHQLKADADRQKLERENEEAEAIRKEARAKQILAKTYAERQRADATEHLRHLLGLAKHFRQNQLLVRCGWAPWQRYMEVIRLDNIKADNFRQDRLLQVTWSAFLGYIIALRTERYRREHRQTAVATAHHRRKLMRAVWRTLRLHHKVIVAKTKAVTGHFSRFTLCRRSFRGWRVAYERSIRLTARQLRAVQPRGELCCKRHYWRLWQQYHHEQLEEREIRQRVNSKWAAVQGWMGGGL